MKLFETVASEVEDLILSGEIVAGSKLSSIRAFSVSKGISHVTAVNVYKKLEGDGLIESTQKGYLVLGDTSEYVRDYYHRKIEDAFAAILQSGKKLGLSHAELFEHLQLLYTIGGENG